MSKWWIDTPGGMIIDGPDSKDEMPSNYRPVTLDDLLPIVESCGGRIVSVPDAGPALEKIKADWLIELERRIQKLEEAAHPLADFVKWEEGLKTKLDTPMQKIETVSCISPEIRGILMCPNCKSVVKQADYICPKCGQKLEDVE